MKRLDDAIADHDPIFGVIAGANTNHCGQTVSITRPHEGDQLALFKRMLRQSNTNAEDVSYVEMHGTGYATLQRRFTDRNQSLTYR